MKPTLQILCLWLSLALTALPCAAQRKQAGKKAAQPDSLLLPSTYSDHMVLQRNVPLQLVGTVAAGTQVKATLGSSKATATADSKGRFSISLPALEAGGPYTLRFDSERGSRSFSDVYVGEVWLCSGQSNMELRVAECNTAERDLKLADLLTRVHLYNMESGWPLYAEVWNEARMDSVDQGLFVLPAQWTRCSSEAARRFSAIGFHFAKVLSDSLKCHVGIICNAVGGSTTEGWIDNGTLREQVPEVMQGDWLENRNIMAWARKRAKLNLQQAESKNRRHPFEPTYLYDAAIRPLTDYAIRGVLWYQGESNADLVKTHERLFASLEKSWRTAWHNDALPFYFVQLSSLSTRPSWPAFRDSQRRLADSLSHTYMVVSSDVGDSLDVHPRRKAVIGRRLAASVLHHSYGYSQVEPCGPQPLRASSESAGQVRISFAHAQGLRMIGEPDPAHFEVCSRSGFYVPADELRIEGNDVVLLSRRVPIPTQVRYAWKPYTRAMLINAAGMPCSTFQLQVADKKHRAGSGRKTF